MRCYESDCKSSGSGADAFPFFTLRLSVLIQYEAKEYFGKGLEQSRLSLFFSLPLLKDFATINALAKNKLSSD